MGQIRFSCDFTHTKCAAAASAQECSNSENDDVIWATDGLSTPGWLLFCGSMLRSMACSAEMAKVEDASSVQDSVGISLRLDRSCVAQCKPSAVSASYLSENFAIFPFAPEATTLQPYQATRGVPRGLPLHALSECAVSLFRCAPVRAYRMIRTFKLPPVASAMP